MKRKALAVGMAGLLMLGLASCGSNVELNVYGVTTFDAGKSIDNLSLDFYKNGEKTTFDINSDTYPFKILYNLSNCEILSFGAFSVEMNISTYTLYTYEESEETYTTSSTYYKNIKSDIYKYYERDNVTFELFDSTDDESNISGING
nr:hypothetical protein [Acholeplasmatales bacterium]